jgi:hypothetical protein
VTAKSHAYISGASLYVSGAVSVGTTARSYANADILESQFSLSVVGVTLLSTIAKAEGEFTAYIDTTGAALMTGSLTVNTTYYAVADAAVGAAGGLGVTLASITSNSAVASNHVNAKSYILGSGALTANGAVNVLTEGYASSIAYGKSRQFEAIALSIAVIVIVATLSIEQSAYLNINGSLHSTGEMNIRSEIYRTGDFGAASAIVGGSGAGASIALIGATVNAAGSFAQSINSAYISGAGSVSADSVNVKAKTVSESRAIARKNFTVGLLTIGSLSAIATTGIPFRQRFPAVDLEATSGDRYRSSQSAAPMPTRSANSRAALGWRAVLRRLQKSISAQFRKTVRHRRCFRRSGSHGFRQCFHSLLQYRLCGVRCAERYDGRRSCGFLFAVADQFVL